MKLCSCSRFVRDLRGDRLRCSECHGWTPHGRPLSRDRLALVVGEIHSLVGRLVEDLSWDLDPGRRGELVRSAGPADPTGEAATDVRRTRVRQWTVLSARLLERTLADLKLADEATGEALQAAEDGPPERLPGTWYPPTELSAEVERQLAYQVRRMARGQGWGMG